MISLCDETDQKILDVGANQQVQLIQRGLATFRTMELIIPFATSTERMTSSENTASVVGRHLHLAPPPPGPPPPRAAVRSRSFTMTMVPAQASALPAPPLHPEGQAHPSSSEPTTKNLPLILTSDRRRQTPARDAVAGACAGAFAKTVVAPIERVKLLMQLQFSIDNKVKTNSGGHLSTNGDANLSSGKRRRCGAWEVTKQVYREQGILAFWRGEMRWSNLKCVHPITYVIR